MRTPHPGRTWYILFGIGAFLFFLLGAAAFHAIIGDADGCQLEGFVCLIVPTRADLYIHLLSYALMTPVMLTVVIFFDAWRRYRARMSALTRNLTALTIRDEKLEGLAARLGLANNVHLIDSEDRFCFCACLVSPRIYVSRAVKQTLSEEEMEAMLLHEKYHLDNYDPLKMWIGGIIVSASALAFTPLLKDLFRNYLIRKEIAADQHAIVYQGCRSGIAGTMQKLLQTLLPDETGPETLEYRVNYLVGRARAERIPFSHVALSLIAPTFLVATIVAPVVGFRL